MPGTIQKEKISKLGFGYMRLPRKDGIFDMEQIIKMADTYLGSGGTYFDAAYVYEGAEAALCESVIKRYPRDMFQIATKLSLRHADSIEQCEAQFKTSLGRLCTDYIDFYLLHGLSAATSKKAEDIGAWAYLADLKAKGLIRHMGFSFHSTPEDLEIILSRHPEAEFVQLQINYMDWDSPKIQSRRLHEIARKFDIPIIIMEPVKGGLLTGDSSPIAELLREANPNASMASWALRFTAHLDGVLLTLSGMSSSEQLADNVATFADLKPLSADDSAVLAKAVEILDAIPRVACTSCRYCIDGCPSKIMIPMMIETYNMYLVYNTTVNLNHGYRIWTNGHGKAGDCIGCRVCEDVCPQGLEIVDTLAKVSAMMDK